MAASNSDLFTATENNGPPVPTTASAERVSGDTTLQGEALTNWSTITKVFFATGTPTTDVNGNPIINTATLCLWEGIVSGSELTDMILHFSATGTDPGNNIGDIIEMGPSSSWAQALFDGLTAEHTTQGVHRTPQIGTLTSPSSTGNFSVTGLPWKPKYVRFIYLPASGTSSSSSAQGAMNGTAQYATSNTIAASTPARYSDTSHCLAVNTVGSTTPIASASFVSMDTAGFTIDFDIVTSGLVFAYEAWG